MSRRSFHFTAFVAVIAACTAEAPTGSTAELRVDGQGHYILNGKSVVLSELKHELRALRNTDRNVELIIHAKQDAEFQAVGKAVTASQEAGIARVRFATEPKP